jgi:hypothetical protein
MMSRAVVPAAWCQRGGLITAISGQGRIGQAAWAGRLTASADRLTRRSSLGGAMLSRGRPAAVPLTVWLSPEARLQAHLRVRSVIAPRVGDYYDARDP